MARIRSIKPEFPQSESMGNVSRDARLLFIQLWTIADDSGRLRGASRMLASLLFPYDEDAPGLIETWLGELDREGCLVRYRHETGTYIQICNWSSHQKIDKPSQSKHPPFDEASRILPEASRKIVQDQGRDQGRDQGIQHTLREEKSDLPALVPSSLYTDLRNAFQSKNPMWGGDNAKHVDALHWLVKAFETLNPESPESTAQAILECYYRLIQESRESFWRRQPFTPSGLRSLWDRVLAELKAQTGAGAPAAEDDCSWVDEMGGKQ